MMLFWIQVGLVLLQLSTTAADDGRVYRCFDDDGNGYGEAEQWSTEACETCICMKDTTIVCEGCVENCTHWDGLNYTLGETWQPDPCTDCECIRIGDEGEAMCSIMDCANPATCRELIQEPDECCTTCIEWCPDGLEVVNCAEDPCSYSSCSNYPTAECKADYCGGCHARFYDENGDLISNCEGVCRPGEVFKGCGSACTATCSNLPPIMCTKQCVSRCECHNDQPILHNGMCIPEQDCKRDHFPDEITCPNGERVAKCFADPCSYSSCSNYPTAECKADYCGGCHARFYDENGDLISNCIGDCRLGEVYNECGSACTPTCSNPPEDIICTEQCVPRCECPNTLPILNKGRCTTKNGCHRMRPLDLINGRSDVDNTTDTAPMCPDGMDAVNCVADPCSYVSCSNHPTAECKADYCGGCHARFYDENGDLISNCEGTSELGSWAVSRQLSGLLAVVVLLVA